jgi:hypothetical protein
LQLLWTFSFSPFFWLIFLLHFIGQLRILFLRQIIGFRFAGRSWDSLKAAFITVCHVFVVYEHNIAQHISHNCHTEKNISHINAPLIAFFGKIIDRSFYLRAAFPKADKDVERLITSTSFSARPPAPQTACGAFLLLTWWWYMVKYSQ